jgi:hypothetical protein
VQFEATVPVVEDKLLQLAVTRILEAIYEQDFLRCSYGYRPNRGALDAVDKLTVKLRQTAPEAADIAQEAPQLVVQLHGMVQTEPPRSVEETVRIAEPQTPWVLQLLWCLGQQRSTAGVLQ